MYNGGCLHHPSIENQSIISFYHCSERNEAAMQGYAGKHGKAAFHPNARTIDALADDVEDHVEQVDQLDVDEVEPVRRRQPDHGEPDPGRHEMTRSSIHAGESSVRARQRAWSHSPGETCGGRNWKRITQKQDLRPAGRLVGTREGEGCVGRAALALSRVCKQDRGEERWAGGRVAAAGLGGRGEGGTGGGSSDQMKKKQHDATCAANRASPKEASGPAALSQPLGVPRSPLPVGCCAEGTRLSPQPLAEPWARRIALA
jgi:hypothetical protein